MANDRYHTSDITFSQIPAALVEKNRWAEIAELNEQAVAAVYNSAFRLQPDVIATVGTSDLDAYIRSRVDPNNLVGTKYNPNQSYRFPFLTLAENARGEIVSVVYSADNVSGPTEKAREAKMDATIPHKRWAWLGWAATHPDYQNRGLSTLGVALALRRYHVAQPTSAYAWSNEPIKTVLHRNGLSPQGEASKRQYDSVELQHYTGSVAVARARARLLPGLAPALRHVHMDLQRKSPRR